MEFEFRLILLRFDRILGFVSLGSGSSTGDSELGGDVGGRTDESEEVRIASGQIRGKSVFDLGVSLVERDILDEGDVEVVVELVRDGVT